MQPIPTISRELSYPTGVRLGVTSPNVRRLQEWLCLRGSPVQLDSEFGPATLRALKAFAARFNQNVIDNSLSEENWNQLTAPMRVATTPLAGRYSTLRSAVVAAAKQLLAPNPREVGGDNRGPWVRILMDGNDGTEWKWCAGFATKAVLMGAAAKGLTASDLPFKVSFGCDEIAVTARNKGRLVSGEVSANREKVQPGDLFLVRRTPTDWIHVGLVMGKEDGVIQTAEGNTNDEGSSNGFEACRRNRGWSRLDFVLLH